MARARTFDCHREHFAAQRLGHGQYADLSREHVHSERDDRHEPVRRVLDVLVHLHVHDDDEQRRGHAGAADDGQRLASDPVQRRVYDAADDARAVQEHGDGAVVTRHAAVAEHGGRVEHEYQHAAARLAHEEPERDERGLPHHGPRVHGPPVRAVVQRERVDAVAARVSGVP